ncbi:MAG: DUF4398 domain-containing protein [Myxococcales bacterium]|nr:DUF4398 domain-containing protein [Myxococcales bacterium]
MVRLLGTPLLLLVGCATAPPTGALSSASAAMGAAHEAGAASIPAAQQQLATARQEFDEARALIDEGDNRRANGLLVRAKADADLATSLARKEHDRAAADELARRVDALRTETRF